MPLLHNLEHADKRTDYQDQISVDAEEDHEALLHGTSPEDSFADQVVQEVEEREEYTQYI